MDEDDDCGTGVSIKRLNASRGDDEHGDCIAIIDERRFFLSCLGFSDVGDGAHNELDVDSSSHIPSGHQFFEVYRLVVAKLTSYGSRCKEYVGKI
jgi:hypothetical protein